MPMSVLPGVSFAEKNGTFTNTERRVQRVRKAIEPVGNSMPDWKIISGIAGKMGYSMEYESPEKIMEEMTSLTPIYGGITYARIDKAGIQWPCRTQDDPGTKYLHKGQFSRGLGKFQPVSYRAPFELPDDEYPFILSTGRVLFHYHGGMMSRHSKALAEMKPEAEVEINHVDAKKINCSDGDMVELTSRRGNILAKVKITDKSPQGVVFMTLHYQEAPVNLLTHDILDPVAKIPEYKIGAVRINRVTY